MRNDYSGIVIKAVSASVPERVVQNLSYIGQFEKRKVQMQMKVTGIRERHLVSGGQEGKDLCLLAARKLLEELKLPKEEIGALIFVSQTTKMVTPSTAFWIHHELGLGSDCRAFDINLGCSGFVEGLSIMAAVLQGTPPGTKGLLLNGDSLSEYVDEEDFATCMMFGDAGTATLVEREEGYSMHCLHGVRSAGYDSLIIRDGDSRLHMDGMQVFNFTINDVVAQIQELMGRKEEADYYLIHQAQQYIVRNVMELCGMEEEKVLTSYERYGNVSGASIPLTICEHADKFRERRAYRLLLSGFGVGLSYASAYISMKEPKIFMCGG